jgi:uncharacterized repeat protein (TIGR01451 family)
MSFIVMSIMVLSVFAVMVPSVIAADDPPVTVNILSPYEILEPSTKNNANDKDGYPPVTSSADVEEAQLQTKIVVTSTISNPVALLQDDNADLVDDLTIDDDNPRDLDMLDGVDDDKLAPGTYYAYWSLDKTGYLPVETSHGTAYNGLNSASVSTVGDIEKFSVKLTHDGGTTTSPVFTITMQNSASIKQNDLDWLETATTSLENLEVGDTFSVRTLYSQNSANGLQHLISQIYFIGDNVRLTRTSIYYFNNKDPGSISSGVPTGWTSAFINTMELGLSDLTTTDNRDYWVMKFDFEVLDSFNTFLIPYTQTIKKGSTWKIDTGYEGFQAQVPRIPANLTIEKYFSETYTDGVVSGPNPPEVGKKTVYELVIKVTNTGGDNSINTVMDDTIPIADVTWENVYSATQGSVTYDSLTGDLVWNIGTLGPDTEVTLSFQVSVTPTKDDVGYKILLNTGAYVKGTSEESEEPVDDGDTPPLYTAPVFAPPDMNVYKTADSSTAVPGDEVTYTIKYENVGYGDAYNVVIIDTIPTGTTYVSSSPTYTSASGSVYTWNVGTVLAETSGTITLVVELDNDLTDQTSLTNYVILDYKDENGDPYPQETASEEVTVITPIMTVTKTANVVSADPSDYITYTITYENTGDADAYNVVIVDTIPSQTTFVSANPDDYTESGDTYTWNIGVVSSLSSGTITVIVKVDAGTPDQTFLTNYVTLNYEDSNGNAYAPQNDDVTVAVTAPEMTITKTADKSNANPGDFITYTISYENTGTGEATDVTIKDTIPAGTTYDSSSPTYNSVSGNTYTWIISSVPSLGSGSITLVVKVDAGTSDQTVLKNQVTLNYDDANGNPITPQESDTVDVKVTAPVMTFSKTVDLATANPGDTLTYTLSYENTGTGDADNVVIKDTIPSQTTFLSSVPENDSSSGDTYVWNVGYVASLGSGTITIKVVVDAYTPDETVLLNTAVLDYTDVNDNPLTQLSDSAQTTVTAPIMTVSKTANVATADPGDTIIYTITYVNSGTGTAANVIVTDTLTAYVTLVQTTPAYTSYTNNILTWELGTVAGKTSGTITVEVTVKAGTNDDTIIVNTVVLEYTDVNDNPYDKEVDTASVEVTAPIMTFSKSVDKTTTYTGDTLKYTLSYENSGDGVATDVTIVDTLPGHTSFVTASTTPTTESGQVLTWNIGTVSGNSGVQTITIEVKVTSDAVDNEVLKNVGTLDYDDANDNPYTQLTDYAESTVLLGSISGTVFNDLDLDGVFDSGESGIPGVTVTLGTSTTTTDSNGEYSFGGLPPGDYTVTETNLDGWISTTPDSVAVTLALDEDTTVNFGDAQVGKIKGAVWNDLDKDGYWDSNEVGIWGVTVTVYDADNNLVATTQTDYKGNYIFENLAPGQYTVVETNLPGWTSSTNDSVTVTLSSGKEEIVNFGDYTTIPPSAPSYAVSVGMSGGAKVYTKVDEEATLTFTASNSGDQGSQLRFATFTAVIYDNDVVSFKSPYTGTYKMYLADNTLKYSGSVAGTFTQERHANFDRKGNTYYDMVTWTLPDNVYLEGGGQIDLSFKVVGESLGSSKVQFFTRSTEDHHSSAVSLDKITDRKSLWMDSSTGLYYPAHNSYDPWDADINGGHTWKQWSWNKRPTTKSFAKAAAEVTVTI